MTRTEAPEAGTQRDVELDEAWEAREYDHA